MKEATKKSLLTLSMHMLTSQLISTMLIERSNLQNDHQLPPKFMCHVSIECPQDTVWTSWSVKLLVETKLRYLDVHCQS